MVSVSRLDRSDHGSFGILGEAFLKHAGERISQSGQEMPRPGEGVNVVPDLLAHRTPFHEESFLTGLGMVGESSVSEAVSVGLTLFVHDVHDAGGVERPESEVSKEKNDIGPDLNGRGARVELTPAELEAPPGLERRDSPAVRLFPRAEKDAVVVHPVTRGRLPIRESDLGVGEARVRLPGEE